MNEQQEEELYNLKLHYHESIELERQLCDRLVDEKFKTLSDFNYIDNCVELQQNKNDEGEVYPLLEESFFEFIMNNKEKVLEVFDNVVSKSSFDLTYFGFTTLCNKYLLKTHSDYQERIEFLFFRVSLFIWKNNFEKVGESFQQMLEGRFTHATPTLFNSGTRTPQLASCFLMGSQDSIESIFDSLKETALISKMSGGIGIHLSNIRSKNSYIHGTNGRTSGIVPLLKVLNETSRFVDQGGGKRKGSFAVYLETWHADIEDFIQMKKSTGDENYRARDLFYALWVSNLFMKTVSNNGDWFLFNPQTAPGLSDCHNEEFESLYKRYVREKRYTKKIKARELWKDILREQIETGSPFIMYKDFINKTSNQQNLGTIKSSNLCTEIMQYSDASKNEIAVCNLASIVLSKFLRKNERLKELEDNTVTVITKEGCFYCLLLKNYLKEHNISVTEIDSKNVDPNLDDKKMTTFPKVFMGKQLIGGFTEVWKTFLCPQFDYIELQKTVSIVTRNLNEVIDNTYYPLDSAKSSNMKHRPMGIGVQALADLFQILLLPYESEEAKSLNRRIFEVIYYQSLKTSCDIAKEKGTYDSYQGSPLQQGKFHFELYPDDAKYPFEFYCDWDTLRDEIKEHGVRNSLLVALMPTASTAQIMGNTESFEALTSNLYVRRTLSGEFTVMNHRLQQTLEYTNLWTKEFRDKLVFTQGSIQTFKEIPKPIRDIYKTVWEMKSKTLIDMQSERQYFIDQSQSANLYLAEPDMERLHKALFYGWKKKLKTGVYYTRSQALRGQSFYLTRDKEEEYQECLSCSS